MAETEVLDEITVPLAVRPLEVFQKAPTATHHLEKTSSAVMIVLVSIEVAPKIVDTGRKEGDLHSGAPDVAVMELVLLDNCVLVYTHGLLRLRRSLRCKGSHNPTGIRRYSSQEG